MCLPFMANTRRTGREKPAHSARSDGVKFDAIAEGWLPFGVGQAEGNRRKKMPPRQGWRYTEFLGSVIS